MSTGPCSLGAGSVEAEWFYRAAVRGFLSREWYSPSFHFCSEGQEAAFPRRNGHGGGANWNRPTSPVDYVSLHGANRGRGYHFVVGGHDELLLLQHIVVPLAVRQPWIRLTCLQTV